MHSSIQSNFWKVSFTRFNSHRCFLNGLIVVIFFAFPLFGQGQVNLRIQKLSKPSKFKTIKNNKVREIITIDNHKYNNTIIGFTDSSVILGKSVRTGDSIMRIRTYPNPNANDTVYVAAWRNDSFHILYKNIRYIKTDIMSYHEWLLPFALGAFAGAGMIAISPLVALSGDTDAALGLFGIGAATIGVSVPIIYGANSKIKYDMQYNWRFADQK